jgi:hypothetical protein
MSQKFNTPYTTQEQCGYAPINISSAGDNIIVAAVSGFRIVLTSCEFVVAGAVNATWTSGTASVGSNLALSGPIPFGTSSTPPGDSKSENTRGWYSTNVGEALNLNLSAAVQVCGGLTYALRSP